MWFISARAGFSLKALLPVLCLSFPRQAGSDAPFRAARAGELRGVWPTVPACTQVGDRGTCLCMGNVSAAHVP